MKKYLKCPALCECAGAKRGPKKVVYILFRAWHWRLFQIFISWKKLYFSCSIKWTWLGLCYFNRLGPKIFPFQIPKVIFLVRLYGSNFWNHIVELGAPNPQLWIICPFWPSVESGGRRLFRTFFLLILLIKSQIANCRIVGSKLAIWSVCVRVCQCVCVRAEAGNCTWSLGSKWSFEIVVFDRKEVIACSQHFSTIDCWFFYFGTIDR